MQYYGGLFQCVPNRRLKSGVQYLFGRRENRNGDSGSDNRVQGVDADQVLSALKASRR